MDNSKEYGGLINSISSLAHAIVAERLAFKEYIAGSGEPMQWPFDGGHYVDAITEAEDELADELDVYLGLL